MENTKATTIEEARPPAWDLLTTPAVGGLHVAASIGGGIWLQGSTIWLHQPERKKKGEKG